MADPAGKPPPSEAGRLVSEVVRRDIRELSAYHVPPPRDCVKLDAMENPYGLPPGVREEWLDALRDAELNRYPDASAASLKARLRQVFEVPGGASIVLGNGSDEIIQMLAAIVDGPVLAPVPTFVMYGMVARFVDTGFIGVPLAGEFELDTHAMLTAIRRHRPAVVFIAYPNNPTGNLFDEQAIGAVIDAAPGLVVIDEAYHAFADRTWMDRVADHPNVMVMRTLSKLGLAGLRLGFAAADPAWTEQVEKVRLPYNVGVLTQRSIAFALDRLDVLTEQAQRIKEERGRVFDSLSAAGYRCFPSSANFILFQCRARPARDVFQSLLEQGVLIKDLSGSDPALAECLRVTIGTPEQNDRFLEAIARA